ncbi:WD40 repeat domain-containing protein [Spirillospora sp. CA-142024]|uniref:WD40 repeat domain-containing protein n=1 Tax=Spirillospora sp. CA-142024 TaxID=3240036 RepID=UPI003D8F7A85
MLCGPFRKFGTGEAERLLAAAGVRVAREVSADLDAIFEGEGDVPNGAYALGIPIFDEASLLWLFEEPEPVPETGLFGTPDLERLAEADWEVFVPEGDLLPLRARLEALERERGVTDAHRVATRRILERGTTLSRPFGHEAELVAFALSPCGRYLATGSWLMEGVLDGFGALQVWEVATGKCVNTLPEIDGGVGWPGERRTIQWSADARHLGMAFRTNAVGVWDPFGESCEPRAEAQVTDGSPRPPAWALHPDGLRAFISAGTHERSGVQGCVVPMQAGTLFWLPELHEYSFAGALPPEIGREELRVERPPLWSPDGGLLYCQERGGAFVVDVVTGLPTWYAETGWVAAWSPDGRYLAHVSGHGVEFLDATNGRPMGLRVQDPSLDRSNTSLHWGTRGAEVRLAVVVSEGGAEPGVRIVDERGGFRLPGATPLDAIDKGDREAWAWAPSGDRGALLTAAGEVQIWDLAGSARLERAFSVPEGIDGVLWGSGEVIVLVSGHRVRFVRADSGEVMSDYTFSGWEEPGDLDDDLLEHFFRRYVKLTGGAWCVPIEPSAAIAPPARRDEIESSLAWTVDHRFTWPLRWGRFDIWPDVPSAAAGLTSDSPDARAVKEAARPA